jgi:sodium transport system permease protein
VITKRALSQAMVVCRKELMDWSRDRRSILTAIAGTLFGPLFVAFMFNTLASRQRKVEDVRIPVLGMANAPALIDWLRQQPGVEVYEFEGSPDPAEVVRAGREEVVVTIEKDFVERFKASKPAMVKLVADSSNQSARPKLQRVRGLLQRYNAEVGSLRLMARGVSPVVANPLGIEDVEVSSAQQRAARLLSFLPLFIMMAAYIGAMQIATDSTAGERERGSLEALLVNPAPRSTIAAGKWLAGTIVAMGSVIVSGGLLVIIFQSIPLQDLGIRFRLGPPQLLGMLAVVLPLCPFIVAIQMYLATFAKSFKEAQSYLSLLMMAQMLPGFLATMYPVESKGWMYWVPWVGQQMMLTDVLGGKPPSIAVFAACALVSLALALVAVRGITSLFQRERIVFGR